MEKSRPVLSSKRINKLECSSLNFNESSLLNFQIETFEMYAETGKLQIFAFLLALNRMKFTLFYFFQLSWYKILRTHQVFMVSIVVVPGQ